MLEFTGPVFAVDVTGDEIITAGKCLALSDKQVDIMKSTEGTSQYSNRSFWYFPKFKDMQMKPKLGLKFSKLRAKCLKFW